MFAYYKCKNIKTQFDLVASYISNLRGISFFLQFTLDLCHLRSNAIRQYFLGI